MGERVRSEDIQKLLSRSRELRAQSRSIINECREQIHRLEDRTETAETNKPARLVLVDTDENFTTNT